MKRRRNMKSVCCYDFPFEDFFVSTLPIVCCEAKSEKRASHRKKAK